MNLLSFTWPLLVLILISNIASSSPQQDRVTRDFQVNYNYPWYSGYLNFQMGSFHYVYFESQTNPDKDPLLLWLNGGPGCSSLLGMVYENGPFVFEHNTTNLKLNPYSWNKQANLLYISSPGGVGFSKGSRQVYNDTNTAIDNLAALQAFFKKFPNLKSNDLYLSGESYSGIYVPYLAYEILQHNKASPYRKMNLKGIMVGNACTHPKQCYDATAQGNSMYQYQFLYKHSYYTQEQYSQLIVACDMDFQSQECVRLRSLFDQKFDSTKTNILNIYGPCYQQDLPDKPKKTQRIHKSAFINSDTDCADMLGIITLFNTPGIAKDMHVDEMKFEPCSDHVADTYISEANASYWIYPELIKENIRVWVYSGDVDADVPITGTVRWLKMIRQEYGYPVKQRWRRWWTTGATYGEDQVGGMYWELYGITFVSIRNAGHMVPYDRPKQAAMLVQGFLTGNELPSKQM